MKRYSFRPPRSIARILVVVRRDSPITLCLVPFLGGQMLAEWGSWQILLAFVAVSMWSGGSLLLPAAAMVCAGYASALPALVPTSRLYSDTPYYGVVDQPPRYRAAGGIELSLSVRAQYAPFTPLDPPIRILCKGAHLPWKNVSRVTEGSHVIVRARITPLRVDKTFSYPSTLRRRGYQGTCKVTHVTRPGAVEQGILSRLKAAVVSEVERVGGRHEITGLFLSLVLGIKDQLSRETEQAFKDAGLSHLLVLSGYQITLVFHTASLLLRIPLRYLGRISHVVPLADVVAVTSFLVAALFTAVAGLDTSSMRAALAAGISSASTLLERRGTPLQALQVSLLLLALIWPGCFLEPGVHLTYAALLGIYLGARPDQSTIRQSIGVALSCACCTGAASAAWFGSVSVLSLPFNIAFGTVASVVSCQGGLLAIGLLMSGTDPQGWGLKLVLWLVELFRDAIVASTSALPWAYELPESSRVWVTILFLLLPYREAKRRWYRYLGR